MTLALKEIRAAFRPLSDDDGGDDEPKDLPSDESEEDDDEDKDKDDSDFDEEDEEETGNDVSER